MHFRWPARFFEKSETTCNQPRFSPLAHQSSLKIKPEYGTSDIHCRAQTGILNSERYYSLDARLFDAAQYGEALYRERARGCRSNWFDAHSIVVVTILGAKDAGHALGIDSPTKVEPIVSGAERRSVKNKLPRLSGGLPSPAALTHA